MNTLHDLYLDQLCELYDMENQILSVLPQMQAAVSNSDVKDALAEHEKQTHDQIERLDKIFAKIKHEPCERNCTGMSGICAEVDETLQQPMDPAVKDAALISMAQRIEHYEIAAYGSVRTFANILSYKEVEHLLQRTLDQESKADKLLTKLATGGWFSKGVDQQAKKRAA